MKNQKNSKTEYFEVWDAGTYQTGSTKPPKKSNPAVTVLLMLVIFLGGMFSALGVINLRQLTQLEIPPATETLPVQLQPGDDPLVPNDSQLEVIPDVPKTQLSINLAQSGEGAPGPTAEETMLSGLVSVSVSNGTGQGLALSEDGFILTFAHLVGEADRIIVKTADGKLYRAALVGQDPYTDLAVLYIRAKNLTVATFGSGEKPHTGSKVTALWDGGSAGGTVFAAETRLLIGDQLLPLLQTSAATGEKAGFLFDNHGRVLGLMSHRLTAFLGSRGADLAYAIPNVVIKAVADQLLRQGFAADRPDIGAKVEEVTDVYQNYWKLPDGLRLTDVTNPAFLEGDILMLLAGKNVSTVEQLYETLISLHPGQTVQAEVYRNGQKTIVELTILEETV